MVSTMPVFAKFELRSDDAPHDAMRGTTDRWERE